MKILVIGSGGREHALVWKLKQSPRVQKIWCAPGNGGIAADAECVSIDAASVEAITKLAEQLSPDLTVVGPELPLVNGISDAFAARHWPIVGPSRQAAQLEGSKIFSKEFLLRHSIPTARMFGAFNSAPDAYAALARVQWPLVIKADGLCAGKGVFVAPDETPARHFLERVLEHHELGEGGNRVLFEEALEGEELSFIILTDGERFAPLVPTRDHKRVFDRNQGPNTGGMGAYSTDDLLPPKLRSEVLSRIVEPTLRGLRQEAIPYQGFLYVGLMLTKDGPKVLEFNCRLGDPETQAIVMRMDFDLAEVLDDVAHHRLDHAKLTWKPGASACVVLASGGYPGKFESGKTIEGLTGLMNNIGVTAFHAGTRLAGNSLLTSAGRVLGITSSGPTLELALDSAYRAIQKIHFEGMHFRKDIGGHSGRLKAAGD
ncbi:MAG TPA: phosphoribosylamine--glycine ligase [Candidatus Acidoferrum sp.]|nr:phosphoribosylamine--glycine ligase [Candidatus Acidoferrum sp.]